MASLNLLGCCEHLVLTLFWSSTCFNTQLEQGSNLTWECFSFLACGCEFIIAHWGDVNQTIDLDKLTPKRSSNTMATFPSNLKRKANPRSSHTVGTNQGEEVAAKNESNNNTHTSRTIGRWQRYWKTMNPGNSPELVRRVGGGDALFAEPRDPGAGDPHQVDVAAFTPGSGRGKDFPKSPGVLQEVLGTRGFAALAAAAGGGGGRAEDEIGLAQGFC